MRRLVKFLTTRIWSMYALVVGLPLLLYILTFLPFIPTEQLANNYVGSYTVETLTVLLTFACVPLALKLPHISLARTHVERMGTLIGNSFLYEKVLQLSLLFIPAMMGAVCHFLTTARTGMLCMTIAIVGSLFCLPIQREKNGEQKQ